MLTERFHVWSEGVITPLHLITGCVNNCSQAPAMTDAEAAAECQPTRSDFFYLTHVKGGGATAPLRSQQQRLSRFQPPLQVSGRPAARPKHTRA